MVHSRKVGWLKFSSGRSRNKIKRQSSKPCSHSPKDKLPGVLNYLFTLPPKVGVGSNNHINKFQAHTMCLRIVCASFLFLLTATLWKKFYRYLNLKYKETEEWKSKGHFPKVKWFLSGEFSIGTSSQTAAEVLNYQTAPPCSLSSWSLLR